MPENADMIDFLDIFLDEEFYNMITTQTNLYAFQFREKQTILSRYSRARNWKDVTIDEMRQFIALQVLTGIVKKPEISQYWSTDAFLRSPIFNEAMPRNRLQSLNEFLHFNDNSKYDIHDTTRDRLYKVKLLVEYLVGKFKAAYTPDKNLSIDEQLLLWKGRLGFKQYIPNKGSRFGLKIFSLCELSGYLWNSFVYLGKEAIMSNEEQEYIKKLGKSGAVVPKLMADLYGKGYHLYIDNWYTSEKLFHHLEENGTVACGTAMGHRLKVPKSMKEESLSKGEYTYRRDDNMLMIRLRDKIEI